MRRAAIVRRSAIAAAGFALLVATSAHATSLQNENLITPLPTGFKIGWRKIIPNRMTMVEYVPSGETVNDWSRMVTVQVFFHLSNIDPDRYIAGVANHWRAGCPGGDGKKVFGGFENGFATALWFLACPRNPQTGKPENTFFKAISGQDSLYVVQYAYRRTLSRDVATPGLRYLKTVFACDTRRADRPCPKLP